MLLTITNLAEPATDLGFLLHKHPDKVQEVELSFGKAHVFYPEASDDRCTAALLLEVDTVALARGHHEGGDAPLEPYVNDRPYVASSFLSVALSRVFGTALHGRCEKRPELADRSLSLVARLSVLPCRGGESLLRQLFEPLGYNVQATRHVLDPRFPDWGASPYFTVELRTTRPLHELLTHLYVLVPVLDDDKHYFVGDDEVAKLLAKGEGWLAAHPERELITSRYLKHQTPDEIEATRIARQPLWNNRRAEHGPFDIIGDVHGCFDEVWELLGKLGYQATALDGHFDVRHPNGRKAVFLGDLADRGPRVVDVFRLAMDMVAAGTALCVPGNHEVKLLRKLRGRDVRLTHGLAESIAQIEAQPAAEVERIAEFIDKLVSHYVLDDGKVVVAHAGLPEAMQGRGSGQVREFALYGDTTGETDEYGLPVRYPWAEDYRGAATVVYGHVPTAEPEWLNRTICIDTGCVFGGRLTALRYPERELISVAARATYYQPSKPFSPAPTPARTAQQRHDDLLDLADVSGKRVLHTRLQSAVTIREENATAALEAMSRFAVDPKWLIYLPPTMSPSETSKLPDRLEHPRQLSRPRPVEVWP